MQGKAADRFSRSSRVETMLRGCTVLCGLSTYAPYLLLPKVVSLFGASVCFRFRARPCITPATCTIPHRHVCTTRAAKEQRNLGLLDGTGQRIAAAKRFRILICRLLSLGQPTLPTGRQIETADLLSMEN